MKRSASREPVETVGSFRHAFQPAQNVTILDLTCHGCKIEGIPAALYEGDRIKVGIANIGPLHATVRWVQPGINAGLRFEQPLHPVVFQSLLAKLRNQECSTGYTPVSRAMPVRRC
tara:strand:+ start:1202 stop:1549 length:348 start_codon:yes stop_codon:yes gene_type:complete